MTKTQTLTNHSHFLNTRDTVIINGLSVSDINKTSFGGERCSNDHPDANPTEGLPHSEQPSLLLLQKHKPKDNLSVIQDREPLTDGYARVYACQHLDGGEPCNKIFRSVGSLGRHADKKHGKITGKYLFKTLAADGDYIQARLETCHTARMYVSHEQYRKGDYENCSHEIMFYNSCQLRICPKCDHIRRAKYQKRMREQVSNFKRAAVLTTTFQGHRPLNKSEKKTIELQNRNFIKMLQRRCGSYELQYIRVLEVVRHGDVYFYHYHYLIDMPYIKQRVLSNLLEKATKDSYVVDIRILRTKDGKPIGHLWNRLSKAHKTKHCLNYVSKYLSKPMGMNEDTELYSKAVYGRHFIESRMNQEYLTRSLGQNSSIPHGIICPHCNQRLSIDQKKTEKVLNLRSGLPAGLQTDVKNPLFVSENTLIYRKELENGRIMEQSIERRFMIEDGVDYA